MKRTNYNIMCRIDGEIKPAPVLGYCFSFGAFRFGVSNRTPDGKTSYKWTVSELTTGAIVAEPAQTRNAAIDAAIAIFNSAWKLDALRRGLESWTRGDVNPGLIPDTAIYTARRTGGADA